MIRSLTAQLSCDMEDCDSLMDVTDTNCKEHERILDVLGRALRNNNGRYASVSGENRHFCRSCTELLDRLHALSDEHRIREVALNPEPGMLIIRWLVRYIRLPDEPTKYMVLHVERPSIYSTSYKLEINEAGQVITGILSTLPNTLLPVTSSKSAFVLHRGEDHPDKVFQIGAKVTDSDLDAFETAAHHVVELLHHYYQG